VKVAKIMNLLNEINAKHRFRDPIYGYIYVTPDELEIIDTPLFQRLRRIHQLALNKYVYPTAEHTRFVHSLGVLQSATNIFSSIQYPQSSTQIYSPTESIIDHFKILRFCALLHDIGHLPFSHAPEKLLLGDNLTHENVSQYIIENYPPIKDVIERNEINPKIVSSLLSDEYKPKHRILKNIISGDFDADRADYLLRDSYFCGVQYGVFDQTRYVSSFRLTSDLEPAIESGNVHTIESFLLARFWFYMQVPFHRTRKGFDKVLEQYITNLHEQGRLPNFGIHITESQIQEIDFKKFFLFDDPSIIECIKRDYLNDDEFAKILMREKHLHPIFESNTYDKKVKQEYLETIRRLRSQGLEQDRDFFLFTKKVDLHKLSDRADESPENIAPVVDKERDDMVKGNLIEESPIIASLQASPAYIRKIYVMPGSSQIADDVRKQMDHERQLREQTEKEIHD